MVLSRLKEALLGSSDTTHQRSFSEPRVQIRYHAGSDSYLAVYHTPTDKDLCGTGDTIPKAFGKIDLKQGFLMRAKKQKLNESTLVQIETDLNYSKHDGEYQLTISKNDGDKQVTVGGHNMSSLFENVSENLEKNSE